MTARKPPAGNRPTIRLNQPIPTRTFTLEDSTWAGLTITVRDNVTIGDIERFAADEEGLSKFGNEILVDWNLTDDNDEPIPANEEGMRQLPLVLASIILAEWQLTMAGPDTPLGRRLNRLGNTGPGRNARTGR